MKIREMREKRAKLIADARALLDRAEKESRALTAEETQSYDKLLEDAIDLKGAIEREEALERQEAELAASGAERRSGREDTGGAAPRGTPPAPSAPAADYRAQFGERLGSWLEERQAAGGPERMQSAQGAFRKLLRSGASALGEAERRALQMDADTAGGFLTTPEIFVARLIKAVDDAVWIRQAATVIPVTGSNKLGVPTLEADPADADWTSELGTGTEDSAMAFGKRELNPSPLAKRIKISRKLLANGGALDPEALVRARLAYKFGISEEKAFLLGTGAGQPLGLFTASNDGIPTSRDVSTGSATDITTDGLKDIKYTLKGNYWPRATWMFHRDGVKKIAKLKDSTNRYLWEDSIVNGEPDRLLGFPVRMSEYVPNTFTTGLYVGLLGDFSYYWIAEAMTFELQRLIELYAETNQVGFIGRQEIDAMPVLAEAFVRAKTA